MEGLSIPTVVLMLACAAFGQTQDTGVGWGSGNNTPSSTIGPRIYLEATSHGNLWSATRDQTMELSTDFAKTCNVKITLNQQAADYTLKLDHVEVGFSRSNQFQLADKNGDVLFTTRTESVAGAVRNVCGFLNGKPPKKSKKDKTAAAN
jgi:hypothetical protein